MSRENNELGLFIKERIIALGLTTRSLTEKHPELNVKYVVYMKRGNIPPPKDETLTKRFAEEVLELEEGSEMWVEFFRLVEETSEWEPEPLTEEELINKLPLLLDPLKSEKEFNDLIELIKREHLDAYKEGLFSGSSMFL